MSMNESGVGVKYTVPMPLPQYRRFALPAFAAIALLSAARSLRADDGAASIAAGGIVMVREPRITMQKEVLRISARQVQVDYEFRNDTDKDITTEVAFPIPPYSLRYQQASIKIQSFEDFKLIIDKTPITFKVETKARIKGRDISPLLHRLGIDIATFGHIDEDTGRSRDIRKLAPAQRSSLVRAGAITSEVDLDEAAWTVEKKYYWSQTFPAHAVVRISHQYTPALGSLNTAAVGLLEQSDVHEPYVKELQSFCIDPILRNTLTAYAKKPDTLVPYSYVDFILTTANTWKTLAFYRDCRTVGLGVGVALCGSYDRTV